MDENLNFTFWSAEIKEGGVTSVKVGSADDALHLTMACFGESVKDNSRTVLYCDCNDRKAPIAVLLQGSSENQNLDLIVSGNTACQFSVAGTNISPVYLSGYVQPLVDAEDLGAIINEEAPKMDVSHAEEQSEPTSPSFGTKRQLSNASEDQPKKKMKEDAVSMEEEVQSKDKSEELDEKSEDSPKSPTKSPVSTKPPQSVGQTPDAVSSPPTPSGGDKKKKKKKKFDYRPSGLGVRIVKKGSGAPSKSGDTVRVKYIGQLAQGKTIFDKNLSEGFLFKLGAGDVVPGFDEGISGMTQGEKRKIIVPSKLAYGTEGSEPSIPPNSDLVFTVECAEIVRA